MDNVSTTSKLSRLFILTGFVYFFVGTILLILTIGGIIPMKDNNPIDILLLFGFVTQLIFAISYIFVPGVSRNSFANFKSIIVEYVLWNIGLILLVALMILQFKNIYILIIGSVALLLGAFIHSINIFGTVISKKHK